MELQIFFVTVSFQPLFACTIPQAFPTWGVQSGGLKQAFTVCRNWMQSYLSQFPYIV